MQTFLPYRSFWQSASVLDKKRCWKQVIEAKQILCNICEDIPENWKQSHDYINKTRKNHPAVKMWVGYEEELKYYYNIFLDRCLYFWGINTKLKFLDRGICDYMNNIWWLTEDFCKSHRAMLFQKNPEYYSLFKEYDGFNNNQYLWVNIENKTYYTIPIIKN